MKRTDGRSRHQQTLSKESMAARRKEYTLAELEALPSLSTSQADDLKIDTGEVRVWLSRCTIEDGEPYNNKATVEVYSDLHAKWREFRKYEAK